MPVGTRDTWGYPNCMELPKTCLLDASCMFIGDEDGKRLMKELAKKYTFTSGQQTDRYCYMHQVIKKHSIDRQGLEGEKIRINYKHDIVEMLKEAPDVSKETIGAVVKHGFPKEIMKKFVEYV